VLKQMNIDAIMNAPRVEDLADEFVLVHEFSNDEDS